MKNIYICEPNCRIHKNGEYLTVRKRNGKISDISLFGVQTILLFGNVQITTQAVSLILEKGIDLLFLTSGGKLKGRASGEQGKNVLIRIAQYDAWFQEEVRLKIAKGIVEQKLIGQKENLKYYRYRKKLSQLKQKELFIEEAIKKLEAADSVSEIMGLEGSAAAVYFSVFSLLIQDFSFEKRVRRPAYDPVNSLLNLTYTFLKNEIFAILKSASFDVELGFLHDIRSGRESLALDFMELYRAVFADRFVITLFNKRWIKQEDFESSEEGVRLKMEGIRQYCSYFQEAMYEEKSEGKTWKQWMEQDIMIFRNRLLSLHN